MSNEDDTYSTMFTALKHPIRRKILRILDQTPTTYTDIQLQLGIDNGLLNYHLDNMKDLITKGEDGKYSLSEFGRAAVNVTEKVEAPTRSRGGGLSANQQIGVFLILSIAIASLSGLGILLYSDNVSQNRVLTDRTTQLNAASQQLRALIPLGELANVSEPATPATAGTQIVRGFPMSYSYLEEGGISTAGNSSTHSGLYNPIDGTLRLGVTGTVNYASSAIVFYNPTDGAIAHVELAVNPVNVKLLELTIQSGDAWRNESCVRVGTRGGWFNVSDPSDPVLKEPVWMSPILWDMKTSGNGVYESPALPRGWYTFSLLGPVTVLDPNSLKFTIIDRNPSFADAPIFTVNNSTSDLHSFTVLADFTLRIGGKATFFAESTDHL
ncbi:MAG: winged helix-turn-helix domain-containing protein [Candidatus Bathyarchaeia archaeon]|jgi:DNA-binding transcriptional ArsR family regulator